MRLSPGEYVAIAKANGYERGAHGDRDSQTNRERYVPNTKAIHDIVLIDM